MSEREQTPMPDGSVVITPTEMYREMQDIGRKVDRLTSALDPWQAEIRAEISGNREKITQLKADREVEHARIEARIDEIKAERVQQVKDIREDIEGLQTAGFVTSGRMWTAVGVIAAVVAALATVLVLILR